MAVLNAGAWIWPAAADEPLSISPRGSQSAHLSGAVDAPSWTKATTALGVTLGVAIVGLFVARRFMPGLTNESRPGQLEILCQTPLGPRGSVYVLGCGPRVLIIGMTATSITTLAEIADADEIAEFRVARRTKPAAAPRSELAKTANAPAAEVKGQLNGMLDKIENWTDQR